MDKRAVLEEYEKLPDEVKADLQWWISEYIRPRKTWNTRHSSYGMKHLFHSCTGVYVTNDQFKGAMVAAGYEPMSEKALNWHFKINVGRMPLPRDVNREVSVERAFSRIVSQRGGLSLKFEPHGWAGAPDRLVLLPGGRVEFVEFKRWGQKPRPLQLKRHEELRGLGFRVYVIDSIEDARALAEELFR